MAKRIYVGGLPYSVTEDQLGGIFSPHGTVRDAQIIMDRFTGQSKGFAFVEMETDEEADRAIAALDGTSFGGRTLRVNEARERESGGGGGRGGGGGYSGGGGYGGFGGGDRGGERRGGGDRW